MSTLATASKPPTRTGLRMSFHYALWILVDIF
jgi:hypothetical protein